MYFVGNSWEMYTMGLEWKIRENFQIYQGMFLKTLNQFSHGLLTNNFV